VTLPLADQAGLAGVDEQVVQAFQGVLGADQALTWSSARDEPAHRHRSPVFAMGRYAGARRRMIVASKDRGAQI
jgi:hypothetical protein